MRIGEFAANSRHCVQESLLQLSDVHFDDLETSAASVRISFRNTKTNKTGPPQTIHLVQSAEVSFCPVRALSDFARVQPKVPGAFFCHFDGTPMTKFQFNSVFRKTLGLVGAGDAHYRAHSFRIGAATAPASPPVAGFVDHGAAGVDTGAADAASCWRPSLR